jgi:hypothetical protein
LNILWLLAVAVVVIMAAAAVLADIERQRDLLFLRVRHLR